MELLLWRKLLRHLVKFLNADIDEINEQLTIDYESDAYMKLIERVSDLSEKFYAIEEVNYEAEGENINRSRFRSKTSQDKLQSFPDGECELSWLNFCKNRI
jgi:hypothetical protein